MHVNTDYNENGMEKYTKRNENGNKTKNQQQQQKFSKFQNLSMFYSATSKLLREK